MNTTDNSKIRQLKQTQEMTDHRESEKLLSKELFNYNCMSIDNKLQPVPAPVHVIPALAVS